MGSSSRKYGCEYMYTDIQLSDWCVCPRVCPNTYYFTTHISYEKENRTGVSVCVRVCVLIHTTSLHTSHTKRRNVHKPWPWPLNTCTTRVAQDNALSASAHAQKEGLV